MTPNVSDCATRCGNITMLPFRSESYKKEKPERFYRPTQALSPIVCSGSPIEFRSLCSRIGRNPQECAVHRVTRFPSQTVEQAASVVAVTREKYRATLRQLRPGAHTMVRRGNVRIKEVPGASPNCISPTAIARENWPARSGWLTKSPPASRNY
jgi:hypothetical protein